jgi:hypothetical protein
VGDTYETGRKGSPNLFLLLWAEVVDRKVVHGEALVDAAIRCAPGHKEFHCFVRAASDDMDQVMVAGVDLIQMHAGSPFLLLVNYG